jgi:hypothetical protein
VREGGGGHNKWGFSSRVVWNGVEPKNPYILSLREIFLVVVGNDALLSRLSTVSFFSSF